MILRRVALFALVAALAVPSSVFAQDDDFIAPLGPQPTKPSRSKKSKTTKASKPKKAKTKKERTTSRKGAAKPPPKPVEDDFIAPLAPVKTELALKLGANARGARLTLDGKEVTPGATPIEVTPGEHTVVARRSGYAEFSERIVVEEGKVAELVVSLDAVVGFATVTADVGRATVLVDGLEMGTTPLSNMQLKPGSRQFEFRAKGLKDTQTINVRAGQQYVVEGKLRPVTSTTAVAANDTPTAPVLTPEFTPVDEKPGVSLGTEPEPQVATSTSKAWYQRWYVWAGVAVVAGAGVGAVMATRSSPGKPLTQEDVCGANGCDGGINLPGGAAFLPRGAGALRF